MQTGLSRTGTGKLAGSALAWWLRRLRAWVLDQPAPLRLMGQRCDRLRPQFVQRSLLSMLARQVGADARLVGWQWDARRQLVTGVLLSDNRLDRFSWRTETPRFVRQPLLMLRPRLWGAQPASHPLPGTRQPSGLGGTGTAGPSTVLLQRSSMICRPVEPGAGEFQGSQAPSTRQA